MKSTNDVGEYGDSRPGEINNEKKGEFNEEGPITGSLS